MYGSHCPNRRLFTKDGYKYLPKLTVKLNEDNTSPVQKDINIYTKFIESIIGGQDNETIEGFQAILGEVGEVVNIPNDIVDMSYTEDINNTRL